MRLYSNFFVPYYFSVWILFFFTINLILVVSIRQDEYFANNYLEEQRRLYSKMEIGIKHLQNGPEYVEKWPDTSFKVGQVTGVTVNNLGQVMLFHRASKLWDETTFSDKNVYQYIGDPPIHVPTILTFNETGELVDMWGQDLFYMPHGITVDHQGNVWLTDVALHQVLKFTPENREKPALVLGERFAPGGDERHFCKPTAVSVMSTGDFFVADGYCNSRIIKFAPDGTRILQFGKEYGDSPYVFHLPHALTLAEARGLVCAADRERGRVACFRTSDGVFVQAFSNWIFGGRIYSVAYAHVDGGRLYLVNGRSGMTPVRGYIIDMTTGRLVGTFAHPDGFKTPHDIATSADGTQVYVAEINPYRISKFTDFNLIEEMSNNVTQAPSHIGGK